MARETLGTICKEALDARGMTQDQAGRLTHFARRTVSDFLRDQRTERQLEFACRLACALNDMTLLRRAIAIEIGVPAAGIPVPDGIDCHPASLWGLARREEQEADEAMAAVEFWRLGPEQREEAEHAATQLLEEIAAKQWAFDALCTASGLDPDELMRRQSASVA